MEEARVLMAGEHSDVRANGIGLVDGDTWLGIAWLDWWLQAELDQPAVLHIWNAPTNTPMIAVNEHLGFRPVARRQDWELEL